jgi:glycosyltransferase involved in cell wall biosynthesis/nucleotide-binding universal stress UspA family protein
MSKRYPKTVFRKVVVPIMQGGDHHSVLTVAQAAAGEGEVILLGLVRVPAGETLSAAALQVREVRHILKSLSKDESFRIEERVYASYTPWDDLTRYAQEKQPDLMVLEWPRNFEEIGVSPEALAHPPCDLAIISGLVLENVQNILVPIRGGPYAELALRLCLALARSQKAKVTSLHISPPNTASQQDSAYRSIEQILVRIPAIERKTVSTGDPVGVILETAQNFDLAIMGATARPESRSGPLGPVAESLLKNGECGVIVVKTRRPAPVNFESEEVGQSAISILVDKWFAENTFHADEFVDLDHLVDLKRRQNLTISLALPALNEEETVGDVISTVKLALMDAVPLLDEIILIDSDSTDRTRQIAEGLNIPVFIHQQILPRYGPRRGKGEALWKSLYVAQGDIILWIDTDIVNIHPHFVYGLIGPLLLRPEIQLVKGFYQRPLRVGDKLQAGGGGRVTELTARPLLNLLYPELSGLIQPLAGEYGGRRSALEKLPFSSGYGVEIGLLIDMLEAFGINAIAQVDLEERIHHNQPLEALSKMSFTIIQTVFRKLEKRYSRFALEEINRTMKLIRYEPGRFFLEVEEIIEQERPPMLEIPEYLERPTRVL